MFADDLDRSQYCNFLLRTLKSRNWICRMFCLMPTHYHLLLEVPADELQIGMKTLNWRYAWWFNRRHARWGHLVGARYGAVYIRTDAHMLNAMRYIARNPVRAGLCTRPEDWDWSSYRRCIGRDDPFGFVDVAPLRAYFGTDELEATWGLEQFVSMPDD
jgi:putative transposase